MAQVAREMGAPEEIDFTPRRGGRPPLPPEERKRNYRSSLTLGGRIPVFVGYVDLKHLITQFRGRFYNERQFRVWVEQGVVPSYVEKDIGTAQAGVRRRSINEALGCASEGGDLHDDVVHLLDEQQPLPCC